MDWRKIKTEYITTDTSYRKLCEKYGVPRSNLELRARKEGWVELKRQSQGKAAAKMADAFADKQAERIDKMQTIGDKLLEKIGKGLEKYDASRLVLQPQTLRQITGALKDLKDVLSLKSDLDIEEQKARIAKLQHEADSDAEPPEITVNIMGGADIYSE